MKIAENKSVRFVYWGKIYTMAEDDGMISIYTEKGDLFLQTTPEKLSEESTRFDELANRVYKTFIG